MRTGVCRVLGHGSMAQEGAGRGHGVRFCWVLLAWLRADPRTSYTRSAEVFTPRWREKKKGN